MASWSVYVVDRGSSRIIQRYPGVFSHVEEAQNLLKDLDPPVIRNYQHVVLPYEANWNPVEQTAQKPECEQTSKIVTT